jgi:hypothetical protein
MDGQSSLKLLVLIPLLALGLSACALCKAKPAKPGAAELHPSPEAPASTRPLSTTSRKAGFGAAGKFIP